MKIIDDIPHEHAEIHTHPFNEQHVFVYIFFSNKLEDCLLYSPVFAILMNKDVPVLEV